MKTIQSTTYPIYFQEYAYEKVNGYLSKNKHPLIFILVDENTNKHCLPRLMSKISITDGIEIIKIESGEINKNLKTCIYLWDFMTKLGCDRKSLLINLGGGVISDMGGFVGTVYKRGITFINIPTTLLSMVDASVGGKTGVDFGVLKNQIGVFSDPKMVLVDTDYLETVPPKETTSGIAEIIKYGLTYDKRLWNEVINHKLDNIKYLIHRSIEIKNEIVKKDRLENNLRKVLNFGHTIGHAVESYFLESDGKKTLTHGESIALGMIAETYISSKNFEFPMDTLESIKTNIINIFGKVSILQTDFDPIIDFLKHDKKNVGGQFNFVLLKDIESYKLNCKVSKDLIIESLKYYIS